MTTVLNNTTPRRRWFQFRLGALFLAVTAGCVALAWLAHERDEVRKRNSAITVIETLGGFVTFDNTQPFGSSWLRPLVGESSPGEVVAVRLQGTEVKDAELAQCVGGLTKLRELWIDQSGITDAGLVHIAHLKDLEELSLFYTAVTDAGLVHLVGLRKLKLLRLDQTRVTDAGLVHLADLTKLEVLDLHSTHVTDTGLVHLAGLTSLRELNLRYAQVTDAGLANLADLTTLEILDLHETLVSDAGLVHLAGLRKLRELNVTYTPVTERGIDDFRKVLPDVVIIYD